MNDVTIRRMRAGEIALAVDWAAREGWNPGMHDADCFAKADPQGFFLAAIDGEPVATISLVNYDAAFSFLGFYIVRPDLRGRGIGRALWQEARRHAGSRTIGLDGVLAQQANYARDGFRPAYRNIRFAGRPGTHAVQAAGMVGLASLPFSQIAASDALVFPAARDAFLRAWIGAPSHVGRALVENGRLAGWGVIRPVRHGYKIGPLVAEDAASAERIFMALAGVAGDAEIVLDVPEPNGLAVQLAARAHLQPVFETARMYTGPVRRVDLARLYGVTSFELG
ncbi:GNAT family N-acetyltransferase [Ancylobacter sp. 6x-1]|uniref:GNAT family N-acetyltransferase n=1 Tax=Ancylobacter crimeensis TaxID=2579147 RepID=A0ABT0DEG6_9HYPH|nr:GNAT family N-acetyltransferase [Ancylobacter crimeensis]MCK0198373.1 GNAT family N-acetyltransferase [Ancylobacter crimeensis]